MVRLPIAVMIPFGPFLLRAFVLATVLGGARSLGDFAGLDAVSDSLWTYVTLGLSTIITEELAPIFGGIAVPAAPKNTSAFLPSLLDSV